MHVGDDGIIDPVVVCNQWLRPATPKPCRPADAQLLPRLPAGKPGRSATVSLVRPRSYAPFLVQPLPVSGVRSSPFASTGSGVEVSSIAPHPARQVSFGHRVRRQPSATSGLFAKRLTARAAEHAGNAGFIDRRGLDCRKMARLSNSRQPPAGSGSRAEDGM
jgi:hypothetical protein